MAAAMTRLHSSISNCSSLNRQSFFQTTQNLKISPNNLRLHTLANKTGGRDRTSCFKLLISSGDGDIGIGPIGGSGGSSDCNRRWSSGGGDESSDDKKDSFGPSVLFLNGWRSGPNYDLNGFLSGAFSLFERLGTSVYRGVLFAAVHFSAELVGTALSNELITMRKKMDPEFETPSNPTPTLLNADTWALHMGLNCNLRYQTLKGIEFATSQEFLLLLEVRLLQSLPLVLLGLGLSGEWIDQFISWASHLIFKLGWYIFTMGFAGH